jgi:hypothetical protein
MIDFCVAWNWEYDADFIGLLCQACHSLDLNFLEVTPSNLEESLVSLKAGYGAFRAFLDRASDSDRQFLRLVDWARQHAAIYLNPYEQAIQTWDKAAMHHALIAAGLYTPYTIILPSCEQQPGLHYLDLRPLGERFTIKPAHGGGGEGVVIEACSLEEVLLARQTYPTDQYLLQAHITARRFGPRLAWFRAIYCMGEVYPCWWDPETHIHTPVTSEEETDYHLEPIRGMTARLASLCGLHLFSTEIAFTPEDLFVVVDYINDPIDLRLQSKAIDGVPDQIVHAVADRLAQLIRSRLSHQQALESNIYRSRGNQ